MSQGFDEDFEGGGMEGNINTAAAWLADKMKNDNLVWPSEWAGAEDLLWAMVSKTDKTPHEIAEEILARLKKIEHN